MTVSKERGLNFENSYFSGSFGRHYLPAGLPLQKRESMVWFGAAHHLLPVRIADCAVKYDSSCGRARFQLYSHNDDNVPGV